MTNRAIWRPEDEHLLALLPELPNCELCGVPQQWHGVLGRSKLLAGAMALEFVALCSSPACDFGAFKTAERMGWPVT